MGIKEVEASNFKSFDHVELELGEFNLIIGANASGKSNLVDILRFVRDIAEHGLDNAISLQGGSDFITNVSTEKSKDLSIKVVWDIQYTKPLFAPPKDEKERIAIQVEEATYKLVLGFNDSDSGVEVVESALNEKGTLSKLEKEEEIGTGEWTYYIENGDIKIEVEELPSDSSTSGQDILPSLAQYGRMEETELSPQDTLIEKRRFAGLLSTNPFIDIGIFDFDPKLSKQGTQVTGRAELEENGENVALVLKRLLENSEKKRRFINLIKDFLPFVTDMDVEKFRDKSLTFNLKETFAEKPIPATLISDGTIGITALIIALYFEKNSVTIIEEPGRNIHPSLISKVVGMTRDSSQERQVIATTHNPEMVKQVGIEDLLLISRDKSGFSNVSRPGDKERVKAFLKNEIGIKELYIQQILEG